MEHGWLDDALVCVSIGATIVAGRLFFGVRRHVRHRLQERTGLVVRKLPDSGTPGAVQVRLKDRKMHAGRRLVRVLNEAVAREARLRYPQTRLACFEREGGPRVWIDAGIIRVIETERNEAA